MQDTTLATAPPRAAFGTLLHQHWGIVVRIAASYAWQREDREELAQEIAAQLCSAWPSYDASRPFTTWMYRVALNTAMAHARAVQLRRRHVQSVDELPESDATATHPDADAAILLAQVMAGLDDTSRALLLLHLEARSSQEIADVLGLSVTAVTTRLQRLRQSLRDRFATT